MTICVNWIFCKFSSSLECLYLKDNCLTDNGLNTWSLPHRMLNTGPEFLKTLDLSCNPSLTDSCLKSLLKFSHLKCLNLSGCSVSLAPGIARIMKLMNFNLVSYVSVYITGNCSHRALRCFVHVLLILHLIIHAIIK